MCTLRFHSLQCRPNYGKRVVPIYRVCDKTRPPCRTCPFPCFGAAIAGHGFPECVSSQSDGCSRNRRLAWWLTTLGCLCRRDLFFVPCMTLSNNSKHRIRPIPCPIILRLRPTLAHLRQFKIMAQSHRIMHLRQHLRALHSCRIHFQHNPQHLHLVNEQLPRAVEAMVSLSSGHLGVITMTSRRSRSPATEPCQHQIHTSKS